MPGKSISGNPFLLLATCAAACLTPFGWLSLPAAMILVGWLPGRALVALLAPLNARPGRTWTAAVFSIVLSPCVLHLVWQWSNGKAAVLATMVLVDTLLLAAAGRYGAWEPVPRLFDTRRHALAFGAIVAWTAVMVFCVYYVPMAGSRMLPNPNGDYVKHHAMVWSLVHYPLPLHNIFYAAESAGPYYYYEHFYLLPAAAIVLTGGGASIPTAFGLWAAAAASCFLAMVFLIARAFFRNTSQATLAAACAGVVGGWDVIPTIIRYLVTGTPVVILDVWCPVPWRIHNLMNDYIWCPQHVSATLTLLLAANLLGEAPRARWWLATAPLLAVSLFSTSVYQAIAIFPAVALWGLVELRREARRAGGRPGPLLGAFAAMAAVTALTILPKALQYREMSSRFEGGLTLQWDRFDLAVFGRLLPAGPLANLLDAPWLILLDSGLGVVACIMVTRAVWRQLWGRDGLRLLAIAGSVGVMLMWLVRSNVNQYDYGFRLASMPALVVGAVLAGCVPAAEMLRPAVRRHRQLILATGVLLGLPVGLYEAPGLAFRTLIERKPERLEAPALDCLRGLEGNAVVQGDPLYRTKLPQLIDRQVGVLDPDDSHVNVFCPLDKPAMIRAFKDVEEAFATADAARSAQLLARRGITHVLAGTHERRRFGEMPQFANRTWFEELMNDPNAVVYRVVGPRCASEAHEPPVELTPGGESDSGPRPASGP